MFILSSTGRLERVMGCDGVERVSLLNTLTPNENTYSNRTTVFDEKDSGDGDYHHRGCNSSYRQGISRLLRSQKGSSIPA